MSYVPVAEALWPPHKCIVSGVSEDLIDMGVESPYVDPHIYLFKGMLRDVTRDLCDMVDGQKYRDLERLCEELTQENAQLQSDLERSDAVLDAVDVLESREFRARRRPGPTKKPKTDKAAA